MKEYKIGDKVWLAVCESKPVEVKCYVCFGKCKVTLILGNNEQIETECAYCKVGFENPRGYTTEYQRISDVKEIALTGKEIRENDKGRKIEYRYQNYYLYDENIFDTKEEAENRVLEMIKEHEDSEVTRLANKKKSNQSNYSWTVGYYRKKLRDAQKDIEHYSRKITELKNDKTN